VGRVAGLSAAETRDRLIEAAAEVFAECGYDGARTSQIARRAGLSTGAIYSQYGTKAELLLAAVQAHAPAELERFFKGGGAASVADVDFLDVMETLGADLPYRARPLAGMLVEAWSAARRDGEVAEVLRGAAAQRQAVLTRMFAAGQAAGEVDAEISAEALARFCLLLVFGSIVAQNAGLEPPPPSDWAALISRVVDAARPPGMEESS
jgi:AcrR family transcriptional regulator